jgi:hypothetical protein
MMAMAYANQFYAEGNAELHGAGPERTNIAANHLRAALFHFDEVSSNAGESQGEVLAWPV